MTIKVLIKLFNFLLMFLNNESSSKNITAGLLLTQNFYAHSRVKQLYCLRTYI